MIFNPETELFSTKESEIFPFHVLCVPLKVHELILGVLVLGRVKTRQEFTAGEAKLVSALAGQAAIALDTARLHQDEVKLQRLEEELSIGRQIQLSFLPESLPDIPGWDFAAMYRSAREVGGDLYDIIYSPGSPNLLNVVIADVTGKGVAAALFMAFTRTVLRLMSIEGGSPSQVLKNTNHHILQERKTAIFVSAFFASIDLRKGLIKYSNAGHDWPMLYDSKTHRIRHLDATGFLLGAFGEIEPDEYQAIMQPGDLLVFYTDGISEAFNSKNELYGTQRIENVITRNAWENADSLLQAILTDVEEFTNDEPQSDDLTILVIKRMEHGL
jgi:sigma-B regulation protein RsbU (phosphoserine phosphatase)